MKSRLKNLRRLKFKRRIQHGNAGASDKLMFLKGWLAQPRSVGAIAPTGRRLACKMAGGIDPDSDLPVLELGPGTGVITQAIIDHNIAPERIICVEYSEEFCDLLRKRFPDITIIQGDAYNLDETLRGSGISEFSAVVSGLPLLNQKPEMRRKVVVDALQRMQPGKPFIQFSYGFAPPLRKQWASDIDIHASDWVMGNVPPARVWTFRRPA